MSKESVAAPRVRVSAKGGEVAAVAARDLSSGLAAMLGIEVASSTDAALSHTEIGSNLAIPPLPHTLHRSRSKATASTSRAVGDSFVIRAGTERGLIHASADFLEKLGAQFAPGVAPSYPRIEPAPPRRAQTLARHARVQAARVRLRHHDLELQPARPARVAPAARPRIHPVDGASRDQRLLVHPARARHAAQDRRDSRRFSRARDRRRVRRPRPATPAAARSIRDASRVFPRR